MRNLTIFLLIILCTSCSFYPYENKVACRLADSSGKCISVTDAYDEARSGEEKFAAIKKGEHITDKEKKRLSSKATKKSSYAKGVDVDYFLKPAERYQNSKYEQLSALIDEPITPMLTPPKTIRTLIISYSKHNDGKVLYMPRYVYSIVEDSSFIMGDYLLQPSRDIPLGLIRE